MPKDMAARRRWPPTKVRLRKKRIGSIGAAVRSSQATNAPEQRRRRRRSRRRSSALVQPSALARTSAQTIPSSPTAGEREPGQVELVVGPAALGRAARRASGTSDEADRDVEPEDPVPGDAADDGAADHRSERDAEAADARTRCRAPRRAGRPGRPPRGSSASAAGRARRRRPAPRGRRSATSIVGASAAAAEAAVKMLRPIVNIRRRPKRSPSAAPVSSSTAKVSV